MIDNDNCKCKLPVLIIAPPPLASLRDFMTALLPLQLDSSCYPRSIEIRSSAD